MKKQLLLIIILTFLNLLINSLLYAQNIHDKNFIESIVWQTSFIWSRGEIIFKNNQYSIACNGECIEKIDGTYLLSGNKITLIPSVAQSNWETFKIKTEWIIEQDDNDLMYIYKMKLLTNIKDPGIRTFWRQEPKVPIGSKRFIDGIPVIKLKFEEKKIIIDAKMRKKPNTQSDYYKATNLSQELQYIPKGKTINILARTESKEKIGNMNDYWYYCCIYWNIFSGEQGPLYCWIYGGLIGK